MNRILEPAMHAQPAATGAAHRGWMGLGTTGSRVTVTWSSAAAGASAAAFINQTFGIPIESTCPSRLARASAVSGRTSRTMARGRVSLHSRPVGV
jgi:hypothetical protein